MINKKNMGPSGKPCMSKQRTSQPKIMSSDQQLKQIGHHESRVCLLHDPETLLGSQVVADPRCFGFWRFKFETVEEIVGSFSWDFFWDSKFWMGEMILLKRFIVSLCGKSRPILAPRNASGQRLKKRQNWTAHLTHLPRFHGPTKLLTCQQASQLFVQPLSHTSFHLSEQRRRITAHFGKFGQTDNQPGVFLLLTIFVAHN